MGQMLISRIGEFFRNNYPIILILFLAFIARFIGISFGYPYGVNMIWDETNGIVYLLDLLQTRDFSLSLSQYPVLLPLLYLPLVIIRLLYLGIREGIFDLASMKDYLVEGGIGELYIIIRWFGVAFGTATVYLIYKIYRIIVANKYSAYFAASVYAFSLVPLAMSHWGKTHNAMTFFTVLSLYLALRFEKNKTLNFFYLSLIAACLSFSSHYVGVVAFIFPISAILFNHKKFNFRVYLKSFFISFPIIVLFYATTYRGVWSMFQNVFNNYYAQTGFTGLFPVGPFERFYYVFRDSFFVDPVFLSLFIIVFILLLKTIIKNRYAWYVLSGIAFNYVLMISIIVGPGFTRWLLVFLALTLPLGAAFFSEYLFSKNLNKKLIVVIFMIMLVPSIVFDIKWLSLLKNNTYTETAKWLETNLADDEVAYTFNSELSLPLSYEAALWQKEANGIVDSDKINHILGKGDSYEGGINLYYDMGKGRYEELAGEKTKYVIIDYWTDSYVQPLIGTRENVYAMLEKIKKNNNLEFATAIYPSDDPGLIREGVIDYINNPIKWQALLKLDKSGPFIEIYKIIK